MQRMGCKFANLNKVKFADRFHSYFILIHPLPFTHPSVFTAAECKSVLVYADDNYYFLSQPANNQKTCTASDIWICKQFTNGRNQILLFLLIIHGQLLEQLNLQLYLIISLLSLRTLYSCAHSLLAYYDCHKTAHECCCLSVLSEKPMLQTKNNDTFPFWVKLTLIVIEMQLFSSWTLIMVAGDNLFLQNIHVSLWKYRIIKI